MTERKLLTLDDFVKQPTTYTRFGEKVTRNPLEQIYNAGLLSEYKKLSISHKYIKFTGMFADGDGGEGLYIRDESITDDEDIGVIIYVGQHKYRRLYGAYVLVDWFYTGDFGIALQRACKYASVRCIPSKVYECNSEITLKLDARSAGKHGFIDHGHVLIDLRGATINYNVEGSSYCFNIRIYNRETKFMLTNGYFNVSEESKVYLKNIANVIGGNNYTDMLTDMHYNVDKELLPDTNRVVLFSEPVIEGVKTFKKSLNYIGDSLFNNDDQAVTKDYTPANVDENNYIKIGEERELKVVTFSSNFITGGNVVTENNVNDVVNKLTAILISHVKNTINNIFVPGMYYTAVDSDYLYLPYHRLEYIKEPAYTVNLLASAEYIFMPSSIEFDEQFIGLPIYNEIRCNKDIVVPKDSLVKEICESTERLIEESVIPIENLHQPGLYQHNIYTFKGANVNYYIYDDNLVEGNTSPISYIGVTDSMGVLIATSDGKLYGYGRFIHYNIASIGWDSYQVGQHYAIRYVERYNTEIFDALAMRYKEYRELKADNKVLIPFIYMNKLLAIIEIINPLPYQRDWNGGSNISYPLPDLSSVKYITLPRPSIRCEDMLVTRVAADNVSIEANIIAGNEYISIMDKASIYVKNYTENANTVSFNVFYVKAIVPVQANLQVFRDVNNIVPTAKYNLRIVYNNDLYISSAGAIYIPRFKIEYSHFQSKNLTQSTEAIARYYNTSTLYTNPLLPSLKYDTSAATEFVTNLVQIPTYGTHINRNQDERDGSGCQCYQRDTQIRAFWLASTFYCGIGVREDNLTCGTKRYLNEAIEINTHKFSPSIALNMIEVAFGSSTSSSNMRNLYSGSTYYCASLSGIAYDDIAVRPYHLECTVPSCDKCYKNNCPPLLSGSGIPGCWFYYLNLFIGKIRMWDYIFGKNAWRGPVYRDGNLKNPYKDRGSRPAYTTCLPVYPYKE